MKKHTEFISYPISPWNEKTIEKNISNDEDEKTKKKEEEDVEDVDVGKEKKPNKKKVKEVTREWELINKQKPIWFRKLEEISK